MVLHSSEQVETRSLGPNQIRNPDSTRPSYSESIVYITEESPKQMMIFNVKKIVATVDTPSTYAEAMKSKLAHRWRAKMSYEIGYLVKT